MKHVRTISNNVPTLAIATHPPLKDSIQAFLADPVGVLRLHLKKPA